MAQLIPVAAELGKLHASYGLTPAQSGLSVVYQGVSGYTIHRTDAGSGSLLTGPGPSVWVNYAAQIPGSVGSMKQTDATAAGWPTGVLNQRYGHATRPAYSPNDTKVTFMLGGNPAPISSGIYPS